jgi:TorA maturation chaperone TorD
VSSDRHDDIAALLCARCLVYRLLHLLYGAEPGEGVLALLRGEAFGETLALYERLGSAEAGAFRRHVEAMDDGPESVGSLRSEYMRLLVGPERLIAPPWESVYVNERPLLLQESTLAVRTWYRKHRLLPEMYRKVADDHIALMTDFLARLADLTATAYAHDGLAARDELRGLHGLLDDQCAFLDAHLLNWLPAYRERLAASPTDFLYPSLASFTLGFATFDRDCLEELRASHVA